MTIGTGSFHPHGRYVFPRSYVYGVQVARYGDGLTVADNVYTIHAIPPDPTTLTFVIDNRFWLWTSNTWSLDHIMEECYVLSAGVPPKIPFDYSLSWVYDHARHRAILSIEWFVGAPDFQYIPLPSPPSQYWLPKPLP